VLDAFATALAEVFALADAAAFGQVGQAVGEQRPAPPAAPVLNNPFT